MKAIYLTLSVLFTALILILAFGNINSQCADLYFLFYSVDNTITPTVLILAISVLGIITGMFYHAFMARIMNSSDADSDEDGF